MFFLLGLIFADTVILYCNRVGRVVYDVRVHTPYYALSGTSGVWRQNILGKKSLIVLFLCFETFAIKKYAILSNNL